MAKNQVKETNGEQLVDRLVSINRVSKTVKGGRKMGFSAIVVVGDQKGHIGYGTAKAKEVPDAVKKASESAKKNMIKVPLKQGRTLHHDLISSYGAGKVILRSAPHGTGIIAGGPMRAIFEVLGITDIVSKSLGSANPHNIVKATFKALTDVQSPKLVALRRGKKISDIIAVRNNKEVKEEKGE